MKNINWNAQYENDRDYVWLSTSRLAHVLSQVEMSQSPRALDIGCGTGQLCRDLVHRGFVTIGVDCSDAAIHQAKQSTRLPADTIRFDVCDIEREDINTESEFDVIFCKYVLPFIGDKTSFLQKVASLKTDAGTFVVISPDPTSLPSEKQHISMNHQEAMTLLSQYFKNVVSEHIGRDYIYYAR